MIQSISKDTIWKNKLFLLFFLLIIAKTFLFTFLIPPWQGPDEPFHFKMSYFRAWPSCDTQEFNTKLLASLDRYRFWEYIDHSQQYGTIPSLSKNKIYGYYAILGFLFRCFPEMSLTGKMYLGRLFSAICYLVIVLLVYTISLKTFTENGSDSLVPLASLAFVGFQPQYSFFAITLNSDNLVSLLLTATLFFMVSQETSESKWNEAGLLRFWPLVAAALTVIIALLVKRSGLVAFIMFSASIILIKCRNWKTLIKTGVVVLILLVLTGFFFFFSVSKQSLKYEKNINRFSFDFTGVPGDLRLQCQAFDIDYRGEVAVLLNGKKIGTLEKTKNSSWCTTRILNLPDNLINDNTANTITFYNVKNPPRSRAWGIRNIQIGDIVKITMPHGNIPRSKLLKSLTKKEKAASLKKKGTFIVDKASTIIVKTIQKGFLKLRYVFDIPFFLILRYFLVQFVSFWFSLGWMIYKMTMGWYVIYALISLMSLVGLFKLMYDRFKNCLFNNVNMKIIALLILLVFISQLAMIVAYLPSSTTAISSAMGRCRFMGIGAVSILIPIGLWAISPLKKRHIVMKSFVCFMIFLNIVTVFQYIIPIYYL